MTFLMRRAGRPWFSKPQAWRASAWIGVCARGAVICASLACFSADARAQTPCEASQLLRNLGMASEECDNPPAPRTAQRPAADLDELIKVMAAIVQKHAEAPFNARAVETFYDLSSGSIFIPNAFKPGDTSAWRVEDCIKALADAVRETGADNGAFSIEFLVYTDRTAMGRRDLEITENCGTISNVEQLADCRAMSLTALLRLKKLDPDTNAFLTVQGAGASTKYCKTWPNCSDADRKADRRIEMRIVEK